MFFDILHIACQAVQERHVTQCFGLRDATVACHSQKAKLSYAFYFTEMPCCGKHCRHEWKPPSMARSVMEDLPKENQKHIGSVLLVLYTMSSLAKFTLFDENQCVDI